MVKLSLSMNGVVKLPPGFRFFPTDEELVVHYLKRKVFSCPLPANIIPEIDVCKFDPWDLPGDGMQERYFFSIREAKHPNANRPNRATASGYWKATGTDKQIVTSRSNQVVGMKKVLVFYRWKSPYGFRTEWIMHEYRLSDSAGSRTCLFPQRKNSKQIAMMQMEDWVVCRIFMKKSGHGETTHSRTDYRSGNSVALRTNFIDFLGREATPSSNSSSITEISPACEEENDSSCNSYSSSPQSG